MNDWKDRLGVVFSTNNNFEYQSEEGDSVVESVDNSKQSLRVFLDRKQRKGKQVTIIANYVGSEDSLKELAKQLKTKCGVGGTTKDGEIIIQGDFREKILAILKDSGYTKSRVI